MPRTSADIERVGALKGTQVPDEPGLYVQITRNNERTLLGLRVWVENTHGENDKYPDQDVVPSGRGLNLYMDTAEERAVTDEMLKLARKWFDAYTSKNPPLAERPQPTPTMSAAGWASREKLIRDALTSIGAKPAQIDKAVAEAKSRVRITENGPGRKAKPKPDAARQNGPAKTSKPADASDDDAALRASLEALDI